MRFLEQGADIPDELIWAVTNGDATFLCGAGVSYRAKLPSFKQLTARIYARLLANRRMMSRPSVTQSPARNMIGRYGRLRSAPAVQERHGVYTTQSPKFSRRQMPHLLTISRSSNCHGTVAGVHAYLRPTSTRCSNARQTMLG